MVTIYRLTEQYPQAQFLIGHSGAYPKAMEDAIRIVTSRDNAYLDLAISYAYEGNVEWFVREAGAKKVVFGTDMPFFDPRPTFGRIAMADISDDEKRTFWDSISTGC
ncbi:amidohydrolase family protein [Paenibacillus koleovorans]|uniref:amidohydrolase family protein n=1 Tax=Paenibacillus koleovorans TaxID=121608 RepID=UPI000FDBEBE8|nr:amidohydrolase family protein [Paenibacillus koleovorans]